MWKSYGFPQSNRKFSNSAAGIVLHNSVNIHGNTENVTVLRHRKKLCNQRTKNGEKVGKNRQHEINRPRLRNNGANIFVKITQNRTRYHSGPAGNNGITNFRRRNSMLGKVEICGVNTARLTTLTPLQMDTLLIKAHNGDVAARQQLVEGNLRLVLSVIQRFEKRGESPDDLFQVGCIGLMKAIANFDPTKQVRFSTYGVPMIAGEVRRYLRDNSAIRVSRSIRDVAYKVLQCKEAQTLALGREPTMEEIARELELTVEEVSQALDAVCAPVSLYDPVYSDGGDPLTVMDQVHDTKNTESNWMEHIALRDAFKALGDREKQILSLRFYDGKTQMEVANVLGISQAQVSRLEKGAISSMRKSISIS
jgi:RNA polymerase sporulation-specific sigma factor